MKKPFQILLILIPLLAGFFFADNGSAAEFWPVVKWTTANINSGATISANSGVSLLYVIDQSNKAIRGYYVLQPGTLTFGGEGPGQQGDYRDNLDPEGTGGGSDSAVTFIYAYGISVKPLTTAQWEAKGITGTTDFHTFAVGSGQSNEPVPFTPEFAVYVGVFGRSGMSQFKVPEPSVGWQ